ncbi:pentatricopeptide repeat domain-containing protein [Microdochium trichocladiopsis]|uniref:Pentatricopeptide repeat domain-containing protein n=1 Tax=Microdochium trichocladiopsis TaxID=1682393 RepID=A0A9P8XZZ2_9PEZI|nr:pentatricopeptide repeat domain-containing protein [Microdochium trichocladiopsis]KAH7025985.1 pentatricopeptide repeat domain-containing protein [Microdochium trichocladiopsis]
MRSQLTRHVLRRLQLSTGRLAATPQCLCIAPRPIFRPYPVGCRVVRTPVQRRTFLGGIFKKEPRALKDVEAEPGYETLLLFLANRKEGTRLPSRAELLQAWREFFAYKTKYERTINSTQAYCALEVLRYLEEQQENPDDSDSSATLSEDDLRLARDSLSISPTDTPENHVELARSLFSVMRRNKLGLPVDTPIKDLWPQLKSDLLKGRHAEPDLLRLIVAFSTFGNALEARDILLQCTKSGRGKDPSLWRPVLHGLAREERVHEAVELINESEKQGVEFNRTIHGVITTFFAKRNMVEETKQWWSKPIRRNEPPSRTTYFEVLLFAIRNGEQQWATEIYKDLVEKLETGTLKRHKALWDVAFQWAVLLLGKGPEHIEHMFRVCTERVSEEFAQPDIDSINRILQAAIEKNDPYLGERFIALGEKLGFEKNEETVMLQIEYRLRANDLDGAVKAFRSFGDSTTTKSHPILNELIRKLGAITSPDYEKILEITSYLEQRSATLEPDTVVSICMAFLRNDEQFEVMDTLSLHTAYYSIAERGTVRKAFVQYCLDTQNSTARAWDAYSLLRQFFPELERSDRVRIMNSFFGRRRADMACHVFGHMRAHSNTDIRPTVEDYTAFFEGLGTAPDEASLKMVHNMWKMDTTTQPNTKLYNSLMVAYIACDTSYIALEFWKDITVSTEGPSYESLHLAFMAYEITSGGDELAVELWQKIQRMEIEVPAEVYGAYVAAIAAHGNLDKAQTLLEEMQGVVGKRPEPITLAIIHNALQSDQEREAFCNFAQREFPPVYEALNKNFKKREIEGELKYRFARPWKIESVETQESA